MKQCPKCKTALSPKSIDSVEVDECAGCKGVWFDKDELRRAKDDADPDLNWMDFEIWKHEDHFKSTKSLLECPTCHKPMVSVEYGETAVEIDYCPSCQGTWLDNGEFGKIIGSLEEELSKKSFAGYVKDSLQEAKEIITGPESRPSEWKDFTTVLRLMHYRFFVEKPGLFKALVRFQGKNPIR